MKKDLKTFKACRLSERKLLIRREKVLDNFPFLPFMLKYENKTGMNLIKRNLTLSRITTNKQDYEANIF